MGKISQLIRTRAVDPFCSLLVRINIVDKGEITRLKPPLALVLGLDTLSLNYICGLITQYDLLRTNDLAGSMMHSIVWNDHMPRVCIDTSDDTIRKMLLSLGELNPIVFVEGTVPCTPVKVEKQQVTISESGASWDFILEGTHYVSYPIPFRVFETTKKRFNKTS